MIFNKGNLYIDSDFEIRIIREEKDDIDILIPIYDRTLNLYFDDLPSYINSRFQYLMVKNIIFRLSINKDNNISTIHILKNIDLGSSVVNFEIDYSKYYIEIKNKEYYTDMTIKKKGINVNG